MAVVLSELRVGDRSHRIRDRSWSYLVVPTVNRNTSQQLPMIDRMGAAVMEWQTRNIGNPAQSLVSPVDYDAFCQDWRERARMPGVELTLTSPAVRPSIDRVTLLGIGLAPDMSIAEGIIVFCDWQRRVMGAIKI